MKQIYAYFAKSFQLIITFLVNFLVLTTFFGIIEFIHPIRNRILSSILTALQVPVTGKNIIILLSATCIIIPVLLHRTKVMLRYVLWTLDCRKPDEKEKEQLEMAMDIICEKSRDDKNNYEFYVSDMDDDNAFALGDRIIIVTKNLLESVTVNTVAGLMAHEVGHIKNHHNHVYLVANTVATLGNTVIQLYYALSDILIELQGVPILGFFLRLLAWFFKALAFLMMMVLAFPERIISSRRFRQHEYEADEYACMIGMGTCLFVALKYITRNDHEEESVFASHPLTEKRLARIAAYVASHDRMSANPG